MNKDFNEHDFNEDEPEDMMGRFNQNLKNEGNKSIDTSCLDSKQEPDSEELFGLLITEDELMATMPQTEFNFKYLGEPDSVKTIEGKEWQISKYTWKLPEGIMISFNIVKLSEDIEPEIQDIDYISIDYDEDGDEYNQLTYSELLKDAISEQNYQLAANLRDWNIQHEILVESLREQMHIDIDNGNFSGLNMSLSNINLNKNKLYKIK
jgi:hypothetical protein